MVSGQGVHIAIVPHHFTNVVLAVPGRIGVVFGECDLARLLEVCYQLLDQHSVLSLLLSHLSSGGLSDIFAV